MNLFNILFAIAFLALLGQLIRLLRMLKKKDANYSIQKNFFILMLLLALSLLSSSLSSAFDHGGFTVPYVILQCLSTAAFVSVFATIIAFIYRTIANRHAADKNRKKLFVPFIASAICFAIFANLDSSFQTPEYKAYLAEQAAIKQADQARKDEIKASEEQAKKNKEIAEKERAAAEKEQAATEKTANDASPSESISPEEETVAEEEDNQSSTADAEPAYSQDDYNAVVQDRLASAAAKGLKEYADTLHIDSVDFVSEPSDSGKLIAIVNCSKGNGSINEHEYLYNLSKAIYRLDDIPFDMVYYHRVGADSETELALSKKNADAVNLGKKYDRYVFNQHIDYQCSLIGGQLTSRIGHRPDGI